MSLATLASGWVMLLLAGALSARPPTEVFPCAGYLGTWILALTLWRGALKRNWLQMMASSSIAAFTIGGPLVWYFGSDLGQVATTASAWQFGPLLGLVANPAQPPGAAWGVVSLLAVSGFAIRLLRYRLAGPTFCH